MKAISEDDACSVSVLDEWADRTGLRWSCYRFSDTHWDCKLHPAIGIKGCRFFQGASPAEARAKAAACILAAGSPMPGYTQHVSCRWYGAK
jgi:hypothetical protein